MGKPVDTAAVAAYLKVTQGLGSIDISTAYRRPALAAGRASRSLKLPRFFNCHGRDFFANQFVLNWRIGRLTVTPTVELANRLVITVSQLLTNKLDKRVDLDRAKEAHYWLRRKLEYNGNAHYEKFEKNPSSRETIGPMINIVSQIMASSNQMELSFIAQLLTNADHRRDVGTVISGVGSALNSANVQINTFKIKK